jgi:hypothetical protein
MRTALFCVNNPKQSGSQEIFSPSWCPIQPPGQSDHSTYLTTFLDLVLMPNHPHSHTSTIPCTVKLQEQYLLRLEQSVWYNTVKQKGHYGYCIGNLTNYPNTVNEMNQKRKHNLFYSLSRDDFTLILQDR